MKSAVIIGLGWVGLPTAQALSSVYNVVQGTVRSTTKQQQLKSIAEPIAIELLDLPAAKPTTPIAEPDLGIICFPPGIRRGPASVYFEKLETLFSWFKPAHLLFISSTSVYRNDIDWAFEDRRLEQLDSPLVLAEQYVQQQITNTAILRFGGLMGDDRIPAKYFKDQLPKANHWVNYLHRVDAVRSIVYAAEQQLTGSYNVCSPEHALKKEVVLDSAQKSGLTAPSQFQETVEQGKRVASDKLIQVGFSYTFRTPLAFSYQKV